MNEVNPNTREAGMKKILVIAYNYEHFRHAIMDSDREMEEKRHKRQIIMGDVIYQYVNEPDDLRGLSGYFIKPIGGWTKRDDYKEMLEQIECHNARMR